MRLHRSQGSLDISLQIPSDAEALFHLRHQSRVILCERFGVVFDLFGADVAVGDEDVAVLGEAGRGRAISSGFPQTDNRDAGSITQIPGGSAANRVSRNYYDWRDRLVASKSAVEASENTSDNTHFISYTDYDNLSQAIASYTYDGDGVTITTTNGVPNKPSASLLRAKSVSEYDEQGRVFRSTTFAVNPSNGAVDSTGLVSQSWFNLRGQTIKSTSTGSATQKMQYDGAGRTLKSFVTDGGGDSGWSDADDVTGDIVLEQIEYAYDGSSNVIQRTARQRFHDATDTGELGNPSSSSGTAKARVSYSGSYYDLANRVTDSVSVGTNGGSAWSRPSGVPSRSDTVLVTSYGYDDAGRTQTVTDPRGIVTYSEYDDLGRTTRTIEAYTDGVPTDDTNRITAYTYDGLGNTTTIKAVLPDGPDADTDYDLQQTKYIFGATVARGDGIDSNDVMIAVRYPDKTTGYASTSEEEVFTTNAVGETTSKEDRDGNVHTFTYDVLSRLTSDAVTTLGSGVDGAIRRVGTTFNTQGLVDTITSYDAASAGNVVNQVQRTYNGFGQMLIEYQAHDGAVNTSTTPKVQYGYSSVADGSRFTLLTYPNGRQLTYNYAAGLNSTISRLSSITDGSTTLEAYTYLGMGAVVERLHPEHGINLTYVGTATGEAGDQYTGLDRFGRIVDHKWTDGSSALDQYVYTYDRNSNRVSKDNALHSPFNEDYTYDNLNRLTDTLRNGTAYQAWDLDALGNSNSVTTSGVTQNRTHNYQNQLTGMGSNTLAFDANGNTTTDQNGRTLVYDAWNRLVEAKSGSASLIRYEYDGVSRRIEEGSTGQFFSAAWQVLEERVSDTVATSYAWSPVYVDAMIARDRDSDSNGSLDERLYPLQDANFNVTAIADASGDIVERYLLDAYGQRIILDNDFSTDADSTSDFAIMHGHQGGKYDSVLTNQMLFRNRAYDVQTMRWLQQDPLGYVDTLSIYLYVGSNPHTHLDPYGLTPEVWTGSGVNNWTGAAFSDYVSAQLGLTPAVSFTSKIGTTAAYLPGGPAGVMGGQYAKGIASEKFLDFEAETIARGRVKGEFYNEKKKTKVVVFLIAPKTDTKPEIDPGCCDVSIHIYFSPFDTVPNQSGIGPGQSRFESFWKPFAINGFVQGINTKFTPGYVPAGAYADHALGAFLSNTGALKRYPDLLDVGDAAAMTKDFMATDADYLFIGHSQGANILMHVLNQVCSKP